MLEQYERQPHLLFSKALQHKTFHTLSWHGTFQYHSYIVSQEAIVTDAPLLLDTT